MALDGNGQGSDDYAAGLGEDGATEAGDELMAMSEGEEDDARLAALQAEARARKQVRGPPRGGSEGWRPAAS